jgi:hypothetical protein
MYIIGDSQTSIGVPMWNKVVRMLEANDNIGPTFELQCPRHPTTPIHVASPEDFIQLAPEGGCSERCGLRLDCGHTCLVKCHSNGKAFFLLRCYFLESADCSQRSIKQSSASRTVSNPSSIATIRAPSAAGKTAATVESRSPVQSLFHAGTLLPTWNAGYYIPESL